MLNVSIKELQKTLTSEKKRADFLKEWVVINEKFDGTKLTLIRNKETFNPNDYTKNWIVAYKGNVLFPEEYDGLSDERMLGDVSRCSIGTSQYGIVHKHLKNVHALCKDIPTNTEIFIEFIQNKPTLTRDYETKHDLFVLGHASTDYIVQGQRVFTTALEINRDKVNDFALSLGMKKPPVVFEGIAGELGSFDDIVHRFQNHESVLGGKAEGVVIRTNDETYKIVSPDQYDKSVRNERKARWAMTQEKETEYWKLMNEQAEQIISEISSEPNLQAWLRRLSNVVYALGEKDIRASNRKKLLIHLQDDLFLTTKLRKERNEFPVKDLKKQSIGVYVLSGKPVHRGHWLMIEKVAKENDVAMVFVSVKDRGDEEFHVSAQKMLQIWNDYLLQRLPKNVIVRFSENPHLDATHEVKAFQEETVKNKLSFVFYAGEDDVNKRYGNETLRKTFPILYGFGRVKSLSIPRSELDLISGTKMRKLLSHGDEGHKLQFLMHLPSCLKLQEREIVWRMLSNGHNKKI